jgi:hypothetical protein
VTAKKVTAPHPAAHPASGSETGGKDDVNPDERMGSNKPRNKGEGDLANPERIRRDLNRYRDEMAEDAPGSGTPEDNP